jgi:phosphoglycolate phosphatase
MERWRTAFRGFCAWVNSVADRHGFTRLEADQIEMLRGKGSREIVAHFGVPRWKLPFIARDMRRLKAEHIDDIPLFPGVETMLRDLSGSGVIVAVVSSDSEANVRRALGANARLVSFFSCGASLFGKAKKFRQVLKRSGIAANDAVCIGDEVRDAEAASKAGIAFAAVAWGYASRDALANTRPVTIFERVDELLPRLTGTVHR